LRNQSAFIETTDPDAKAGIPFIEVSHGDGLGGGAIAGHDALERGEAAGGALVDLLNLMQIDQVGILQMAIHGPVRFFSAAKPFPKHTASQNCVACNGYARLFSIMCLCALLPYSLPGRLPAHQHGELIDQDEYM
jgi:hypothetical protein